MIVRRLLLTGLAGAVLATGAGCAATVPPPPAAVGDDYPGTCLPAELSWPTDFLESLPGESDAVGGSIVGLRLEYVDARWVWRLRSADTAFDAFGEQRDDPAHGREAIVDARTWETLASQEAELTDAEQQDSRTGILAAAQRSGEKWPSPLVIEMARVIEGGAPAWRVATCDTQTNAQSVQIVR